MALDMDAQFSGNLAAIAQQGVMINQQIAHHTQTQAVNNANTIGPMEAIALAVVERASRPNDFAALSTSHGVPNPQARSSS